MVCTKSRIRSLALAVTLLSGCSFTADGNNAVDAGAGAPLHGPDGALVDTGPFSGFPGPDTGADAPFIILPAKDGGRTGPTHTVYCSSTTGAYSTCYTLENVIDTDPTGEVCGGATPTGGCPPPSTASGCCNGLPLVDGVTKSYCVYGASPAVVTEEQSTCESMDGTWSGGGIGPGCGPGDISLSCNGTTSCQPSDSSCCGARLCIGSGCQMCGGEEICDNESCSVDTDAGSICEPPDFPLPCNGTTSCEPSGSSCCNNEVCSAPAACQECSGVMTCIGQGGLCAPGGSDGGAECSILAACCASIPASDQSVCYSIVTDGTGSMCQAALMTFMNMGYCGGSGGG